VRRTSLFGFLLLAIVVAGVTPTAISPSFSSSPLSRLESALEDITGNDNQTAQLQSGDNTGVALNNTNATTDTTTQPAMNTYKNPEWGISMQYPSNWRASTIGLEDYTDLIAFYSPLQNISDSNVRFRISATNYTQNVSLDDIKNSTSAFINQSQSQFSVIKPEDITLAGHQAYRLVVGEMPFQNGSQTFYTMTIWTVAGKELYEIEYGGVESAFNQHLPEVSRMLDSFLITSNLGEGTP
jgi:PsbP-like protein